MINNNYLFNITVDEFKQIIDSIIKDNLNNKGLKNKKEILSKKLISIKDISKHFSVSKPTIYKWKRCGILPPPIKMGGRVYYFKYQIEKILNNKTDGSK
jgi:predicted DNA-binding transcriptional regulator AlpA